MEKFLKRLLAKELAKRIEEQFGEIALHYEFEIEPMRIEEEQDNIFSSFSARNSRAKVVELLKSIRSRVVIEEVSWLKRELWSYGCFVERRGQSYS